MEYKNYSLADLVENTYFQQWVKQPDTESNAFWQDWATQHSEHKEMLEQARQILLFLQNPKPDILSKKEMEDLKVDVKKRIFGENK